MQESPHALPRLQILQQRWGITVTVTDFDSNPASGTSTIRKENQTLAAIPSSARVLCAALALLMAGCAGRSAPTDELSLHDRFVQTALTYSNGEPVDHLVKWSWPMLVSVEGDQTYFAEVEDHVALLGQLIDLPARIVPPHGTPNVVVRFGTEPELQDAADAAARYFGHPAGRVRITCLTSFYGAPHRYRVRIAIRTDLPAAHIRRCIVQEITQVLGFNADTDGRTDTTFSSGIGTDYLTDADLALIEVLYDDRLYAGMPRADVLELLPAIVADVEAGELVLR